VIFAFGDSDFVSLCLRVHYNVLKKSFVTFCGLHIYFVIEPKQSKKIPRNHKLRGILNYIGSSDYLTESMCAIRSNTLLE
jgi:hypothetical protein